MDLIYLQEELFIALYQSIIDNKFNKFKVYHYLVNRYRNIIIRKEKFFNKIQINMLRFL